MIQKLAMAFAKEHNIDISDVEAAEFSDKIVLIANNKMKIVKKAQMDSGNEWGGRYDEREGDAEYQQLLDIVQGLDVQEYGEYAALEDALNKCQGTDSCLLSFQNEVEELFLNNMISAQTKSQLDNILPHL